LGVFALMQEDETSSNDVLQLAINQDGVIHGNFYEALLESTSPVYGAVNKQTQRAAWSISNNKTTVYETKIYNLTKPETPILVHFEKQRTQQWLLVRLKKPAS